MLLGFRVEFGGVEIENQVSGVVENPAEDGPHSRGVDNCWGVWSRLLNRGLLSL